MRTFGGVKILPKVLWLEIQRNYGARIIDVIKTYYSVSL